MKAKIQPKPVKKIHCPKCGELMVKLYPYTTIDFQGTVPMCGKCMSK